MLSIKAWLESWREAVTAEFGAERIRFMGIQGSRARGEALEGSDIDVVLVLDELDFTDAMRYRRCVDALPEREKLCGFISGAGELMSWPRHELYQFCLDTEPLLGTLDEYAALVTEHDILVSAQTALGGAYHLCLHNLLHERSEALLREAYKSAFFALRAVHRLETGEDLRTRREIAEARPGDAWLVNSSACGSFDEISERLLRWASETLIKLARGLN